MVASNKPLPQSKAVGGFVRASRKIYNPLGFKNGYNFPLFIIFVGALFGFALSRFMYLNINGKFITSTIPGDAVRYLRGVKRAGIIIHLACILPAAFLVCFQFVPVIRHKVILFHRLNGYVIILLFLTANAGAYILVPTTAGGHPATQAGVGLLATATTISIILAYINIKRLRIDLHRAWMLRTWAWAASIISLRLIALAGQDYLKKHLDSVKYYDVQNCESIWSQYALFGVDVTNPRANPVPMIYPQCTSPNASVHVPVRADPSGQGPENFTASMSLLFGMSLWLAWAIHAALVEIYLWVTPKETERLRNVSMERRAEAGRGRGVKHEKNGIQMEHAVRENSDHAQGHAGVQSTAPTV